MRKSAWLLLCLVIFLLVSCVNGKKKKSCVYLPGQIKPTKEKVLYIKQIVSEPLMYQGKRVKIVGEYKGWMDKAKNPLITRSDWVIDDGTGAVYVTGMSAGNLDPYEDVGTKIEVIGIVQIKDKMPYIEAIFVNVR